MSKFSIQDHISEILNNSNSDLEKIRKLNDFLRLTFEGWKIILTKWVYELSLTDQESVMWAVRTFSDFTEDNDPHEEHDFWAISLNWKKYFWKIDYYSTKNDWWGSPNPADPELTERVLTIMKAEEY